MVCTSYNKTAWEVREPHHLMLLWEITIYTEKCVFLILQSLKISLLNSLIFKIMNKQVWFAKLLCNTTLF